MQSNKKYPLCMFVILNMSIVYPVVKLLLSLAIIINLVQGILFLTELVILYRQQYQITSRVCFQVSSIAVFVGLSHTYVTCCINVIGEKISHRLCYIDIMYFDDKMYCIAGLFCGRKLTNFTF